MRTLLSISIIAALSACSGDASNEVTQEPFDVLLNRGQIYNGNDSLPIMGDVGIRGDRIAAVGGDLSSHPRNYGTFSRLIGHYSRDEGVVPLHTAIYKVSKLPAERINVSDRGRIEGGAYADIAVLDLNEVIDTATLEEPHQYAKGAHHVFVNGEAVLLSGTMTGERPGVILRATDYN